MSLQDLIISLCAADGVTGREDGAAAAAIEELKKYAKVTRDVSGNVIGEVFSGSNCPDAPHILLDAHMDQVGLIITQIDDEGFVHFQQCGSVDRRILLGKPVVILGKERVEGIISSTPPHLADKENSALPEISAMVIDTGLTVDRLRELAAPGDRIIIESQPHRLLATRLAAPALDDRCGVAAILRCLELVKEQKLDCRVSVLFSVQEETSGTGAATGAFAQAPDEAIAIDVNHAKTPDAAEDMTVPMGGGAMIGIAPGLSFVMSQKLMELARAEQIPFQEDVCGGRTYTNADHIAVSCSGVTTGLLSIPLKYMHTSVEMIDMEDVEATARLLAVYLLSGGINGRA